MISAKVERSYHLNLYDEDGTNFETLLFHTKWEALDYVQQLRKSQKVKLLS